MISPADRQVIKFPSIRTVMEDLNQEVTDRSIADVVPTGGRVLPPPPNKEISHRAAVTRLGLWNRELDHGKRTQLALTAVTFDTSGSLVFIRMSYCHFYLAFVDSTPNTDITSK